MAPFHPPRLVLVESRPQDLPFAAGSPSAQPLAQAWLQLLDTAQESVHIASYYWSLTGLDIGVNDSSSQLVRPPLPAPPQRAGAQQCDCCGGSGRPWGMPGSSLWGRQGPAG